MWTLHRLNAIVNIDIIVNWECTTNEIDDLCVSSRKALRRVSCLPNTCHSYCLSLLSQCLPLFDEISRRYINLSALVFRMNPLLLGIFFSTLFSIVEPCRVLVRLYYFVCVVITALFVIHASKQITLLCLYVFRLFDENVHCTANFYFS